MILKLRSRKQGRPAPRHALHAAPPAAFPGALETGPFPAVSPGSALTGADFRRPAGQATAPQHADPADLTATFVPDFAEDAPQDRQRPYVPQPAPAVTGHMLAILGSVCIGTDPLAGRLPYFAGDRTDDEGRRLAGVTLGCGTKAWEVFETSRVDVLDALELAVRQARDFLVYGSLRPPAVPADPEAAGHREVLERELDACADQARGVLRAAGNLGFLSAALRQRDGEGALDVFVARAALANAIGSGDEPAAVKAAGGLVDIISELCGDEVACAIANGIVPSGEAEPSGPAVPAEAVTAAGEAMAS